MLPFDKKVIGEKLLFTSRNRWATQVNDKMVRNGALWNDSLKKVDDYTLHNYHQLRVALGKLTAQENSFLAAFTHAPFYAVHFTESPDVLNDKGDLILYSRRKLISKGIKFNADNTQPIDVSMLGNDGNVFFSLEVGEDVQKTSSRFGNIFYKIPYSHPVFRNSSLVLTDQVSLVKPSCHLPGLSQEGIKQLSAREFQRLSIFFNGKMLSILGLAYSILFDNRRLPQADQLVVLSARTPSALSNVMNSFFRPEIRVPTMIGIKQGNYSRHAGHCTIPSADSIFDLFCADYDSDAKYSSSENDD